MRTIYGCEHDSCLKIAVLELRSSRYCAAHYRERTVCYCPPQHTEPEQSSVKLSEPTIDGHVLLSETNNVIPLRPIMVQP